MVISIMAPHFPALGSGGMPPVPQTILMSAWKKVFGLDGHILTFMQFILLNNIWSSSNLQGRYLFTISPFYQLPIGTWRGCMNITLSIEIRTHNVAYEGDLFDFLQLQTLVTGRNWHMHQWTFLYVGLNFLPWLLYLLSQPESTSIWVGSHHKTSRSTTPTPPTNQWGALQWLLLDELKIQKL